MSRDRVPDAPPREIRIYVTPGEEVVVEGADQFADWELEAVYARLLDMAYHTEDDDDREGEDA